MLNPLGMIVRSVTPEKPADRMDLSLENVAPGVYYPAIGHGAEIYQFKLVKK